MLFAPFWRIENVQSWLLVAKCTVEKQHDLSVNSVLKCNDNATCLKQIFREDMYAQDSIELLTTSGIQFKKHEEEGIETLYFAELLMTSGVVLCEGVKWLSFHR